MPEIGDPAPDFTLPRDGGGTVALSDLSGKSVILFFYPKADTSGCTREAVEFTGHLEALGKSGAVVIGISKDPVKKLDRFRDKHDLGVILASDEEGDTCERYGVWKEKSMYGKTYMGIERSTFLIDPDGKIAEVWRKVKVPGHADAVLERVLAG